MSLSELGMRYVDSFLKGEGKVSFVEHLADGSQSPFVIDNIFPFTSIADIKRMLWMDEIVQGAVSYTPKYVFMAYEKEGGYAPIEFYWGSTSGLPGFLQDPLSLNLEPNAELVDAEGNRRSVSPRMNLFVTLEDSLKANNVSWENTTIHIWRLNQIIGNYMTEISSRIFDGFIRLYFPWLVDITQIEESLSNDPEENSEAYAACQIYISSRQEQLLHIQHLFEKNSDNLGTLSCRGIESLQIMIPKISPLPESLEILFYELKLSAALPYLRYFSESGEQEPIMRYLKNVYLPSDVLTHWIKEIPETKGQIVVGKILIRGANIPVGSAFDILFFGDNTNRVTLQTDRKDALYPGTLVDNGLSELSHFIETNPFSRSADPMRLVNLHGKFVWEHPNVTSSKPTLEELKERIRLLNHLFDLEPTDSTEPNVLKIRYRALSNYEAENEIFRYISRVITIEMAEADYQKAETAELFAEKIKKRFGRSFEQSLLDFGTWLERRGQYQAVAQGKGEDAVPSHHDGVLVTVRNNHPNYEIEIANIQEQTSFSRILSSLAIMLIEKPEKYELSPQPAIITEAMVIVNKEDAEGKDTNEAISIGTRAPYGFGADTAGAMDFLNLIGEEDEEGKESEESEGDKAGDKGFVEGEKSESPIGTVSTGILRELSPESLASRASIPGEKIPIRTVVHDILGNVTEFYIRRLKELDVDLFGYQDKRTGKAKGYSVACQTSNGDMPNSMSRSQYNRMKEIYKEKITFVEGPKPKGWKLEKDYPDCTWDWDSKNGRPVWVTMRTGSSTKRNWFICSKYWCLQDDLPLIESEFEINKQCPFCSGAAFTGEKAKKGETVLIRRTHKGFKKFIGFQTGSKHPEGYPLPCCGGKGKEERLIDKSRPYAAVSPTAEAVKVSSSVAAASAIATSLIDTDEEIPLRIREEIEEERKSLLESMETRAPTPIADINKILGSLKNKYIKSAGKYPLGPGELGIVPKQIDSLFGQDSGKSVQKSGPQQMLSGDQLAFIRFGLQNNDLKPGDRFLSLIGFFMGTFNIETVKEKMATSDFIHAFEDANYGTLVHEFARPDLPMEPRGSGFENFMTKYGYETPSGRANVIRLYYAYENFINYVKDPNTVKDIRYFDHLFMMPGVLFPRGIQLIRIIRDMESDDWSIECPSFGIPEMRERPAPVFVIHDSKYHYWEPLVLYAATDRAITIFEDRKLVGKIGWDMRKSIHEWTKSIRERGVGCGRLTTPPYTWAPAESPTPVQVPTIKELLAIEGIKPIYIVRERSNRFVGFVYRSVSGKSFFLPARDDGSCLYQYKRVYESKAIPKPTFVDLMKFYADNGFGKIAGLKPISLVSMNKAFGANEEQAAFYVGLRLESGAIIPIDPTNEHPAEIPVEAISQFPWEIDEILFPYTAPMSDETVEFATAESFMNEAYQYLRIIVAHHFKEDEDGDRVLHNLENLRKAFHLPLYERRKRADLLLETVVRRFIKQTPYNDRLKEMPRIRKDCSKVQKAEDCPKGMCSWVSSEDGKAGRCLLHAPVSTRFPNPERVFTSRLVEEVLRNPFAFMELAKDNVSLIRPLKGTIQTENEIITTEAAEHVRALQEQGLRKIQKTKYTQGHRFAEEEPAPIDVLRAVIGISNPAEAKSIIEQMTRMENASLHLKLPTIWDQYFSILSLSPEMEDERVMTGLIMLLNFAERRKSDNLADATEVKRKISLILKKIDAPAEIQTGGWRNSIYDWFSISFLMRKPIVWCMTEMNGQPRIHYYLRPNIPFMDTRNFIILWGSAPDIVMNKEGTGFFHLKIALPDNLLAEIAKAEKEGRIIETIDQVALQMPISSVSLGAAAGAGAVAGAAMIQPTQAGPLETVIPSDESLALPASTASTASSPPAVEMEMIEEKQDEDFEPLGLPLDEQQAIDQEPPAPIPEVVIVPGEPVSPLVEFGGYVLENELPAGVGESTRKVVEIPTEEVGEVKEVKEVGEVKEVAEVAEKTEEQPPARNQDIKQETEETEKTKKTEEREERKEIEEIEETEKTEKTVNSEEQPPARNQVVPQNIEQETAQKQENEKKVEDEEDEKEMTMDNFDF